MLHPNFEQFAKRPAVRKAVLEYRAVFADWKRADRGPAIRRAEYRVNLAVEECLMPRSH